MDLNMSYVVDLTTRKDKVVTTISIDGAYGRLVAPFRLERDSGLRLENPLEFHMDVEAPEGPLATFVPDCMERPCGDCYEIFLAPLDSDNTTRMYEYFNSKGQDGLVAYLESVYYYACKRLEFDVSAADFTQDMAEARSAVLPDTSLFEWSFVAHDAPVT